MTTEATAEQGSGRQEVHILHDFGHDFYGELLKVVVLGFIRPEYNYTSLGPCPSPRSRRC